VSSIGRKHGKSGAQVALKWQVQQQIPVIPKAQQLAYQEENLALFGWELSQEDLDALSGATSPGVSGGANGTSGDCSVP
jgi:diketogulonate reductase-like aldo/keto reductase